MATIRKKQRSASCNAETQLNQQFEDSLALLRAASVKAVETLLFHATNEGTPPQVRIHAAQILLSNAVELHKLKELEEKVRQIEDRLNNN
jgi:hypothetical protein